MKNVKKTRLILVTAGLCLLLILLAIKYRNDVGSTADPSAPTEISLLPDARNPEVTTIVVNERGTNVERMRLQVPSLYRDHYHATEYVSGSLFAIRRFTSPQSNGSESWHDELWSYDVKGEGKRLFSGQGIDFRVSPTGKKIAITVAVDGMSFNNRLLLIDTDGKLLNDYTEVIAIDTASELSMSLLQWHEDRIWVSATRAREVISLFKIDTATGDHARFDLASLKIVLPDFALNPSAERIAYSTYVTSLETEPSVSAPASLRVYDLKKGNVTNVIDEDRKRPFSPIWLDAVTLGYSDNDSGNTLSVSIAPQS